MARALKRDATEPGIVKALERAGCQVIRLDRFDLLVHRAGRLYMLDAKSPGGRPTQSQAKLTALGWPLRYVETPQQALTAVGL